MMAIIIIYNSFVIYWRCIFMVNYLFPNSGDMIYGFFMSFLFIMISVGSYFLFRAFYTSKMRYGLNRVKK